MKVYCKNCKYYCSLMYSIMCHFEENPNKYTGAEGRLDTLERRNSTGDCKFYKRRWYKFWIK